MQQGMRLPLFVYSTQALEEVPHGLGALLGYGVTAAYTPPLNEKSLVNRMVVLLERQRKMDSLYTEVGEGKGAWGVGGLGRVGEGRQSELGRCALLLV